jgi:hypothetical protein
MAIVVRQELQESVAEALRSFDSVGRPDQRLLQERWYLERVVDAIENADDDGIILRGFGDGKRLVGQGLTAFERATDAQL